MCDFSGQLSSPFALQSLAAYKKCLELAPPNYAPRLDIRHEITLIQNNLNA